MKHKHDHCEHDLKYCEHCDVVYCTKCDREWGGHQHWTWYYSGTPYRVTWDGGYILTYANTGKVVSDYAVLNAFNMSTPNQWEDSSITVSGHSTHS